MTDRDRCPEGTEEAARRQERQHPRRPVRVAMWRGCGLYPSAETECGYLARARATCQGQRPCYRWPRCAMLDLA